MWFMNCPILVSSDEGFCFESIDSFFSLWPVDIQTRSIPQVFVFPALVSVI